MLQTKLEGGRSSSDPSRSGLLPEPSVPQIQSNLDMMENFRYNGFFRDDQTFPHLCSILTMTEVPTITGIYAVISLSADHIWLFTHFPQLRPCCKVRDSSAVPLLRTVPQTLSQAKSLYCDTYSIFGQGSVSQRDERGSVAKN